MKRLLVLQTLLVVTLLFLAIGCRAELSHEAGHEHEMDEMPQLRPAELKAGEKLRVVATTSIVADVVQQVGGDAIELATLLPVGADPHTFEPTPQDVAVLADAHVIFANGAGLELFLEDLLESAGGDVAIVPVSYGIELLRLEEEEEGKEAEHHHHGDTDPHVWFDPQNVVVWVNNIEQALAALDPRNTGVYQTNAARYRAELEKLDGWIEEMVAQVPQENRKLVVDHKALAYFARRYGFEQVGAVFPGYSTLTEPSAQELAALEEVIRGHNARAVFVSTTVNPTLAERVAQDTGAKLVFLYTGSLSEPGGPADNYISLMKYNTSAIVNALR